MTAVHRGLGNSTITDLTILSLAVQFVWEVIKPNTLNLAVGCSVM